MTRALKQFLKLKKGYCERQECGCLLISMWRDYENHPEYCGCGDATIGDMHTYATQWFANSEILDNVSDADQVIADAQTIIDGAGEELRPFYNAVKQGKTLEAWASNEGITLDNTGTCDDELVANNAAFTLYVSGMGAFDCKYLGLDNDELINADAIADYLDEINND